MTDALNQAKSELRTRMRETLAAMPEAQRHAAALGACAKLAGLEAFRNAAVVMLYLPLTAEVDTTSAALACFRAGKTLCVPKVDWQRKQMQPVETTSLDDDVLDTDAHGVRVPRIGKPIQPGMIDLVVVPGLAFDPRGNRLGRGGGYYDRFLSRLKPDAVMVGLGFDQQIVDAVPAAPHDIPMDIVVTDRRVTNAAGSGTKA